MRREVLFLYIQILLKSIVKNNLEIIDTEKRNQNKEYRIESPHFMQNMELSSSNPFVPWDSKVQSLQYDSPPKESLNNPVEALKLMIEQAKSWISKDQLSLTLQEFITKPDMREVEIQHQSTGIRTSQNFRDLESENENLSTQLALWKESNHNLKEKYDKSYERSKTLEKLLREREGKILHYSTELENANLMETQLQKEIDMYKSQREEIELKYKELKLNKGKETIQIRQLKSDIDCK